MFLLLLVSAGSSFFAQTKTSVPGEQVSSSTEQQTTPRYDLFKKEVEPIFLKERPGHARCYGCHVLPGRVFHLQPLPAGSDNWTEEQSQRNFESVLRVVDPRNPMASRLILHPLAPEAGGDAFHSGGRQFESQNDPDWRTLSRWVKGEQKDPVSDTRSWIYVTNSAADTIDVIDAATNRVVQVIRGIELPHGVNFSSDGTRVYVSNESESVLDVVDRESGKILNKVSLSGRPNNISVTKDGAHVLVGIRAKPGAIEVIDTASLRSVKSIPVDGPVHNLYVTPDGKYAVAGSIENKAATVVDLSNDEIAWEVKFDAGVRPMAFETNADGSTKRIFMQLSGVNGFAVVDFAKRAEVTRIKLPDEPGGFGEVEGRLGTPSHGISVAPNGTSLWVSSTVANAAFKYSLPDLKVVGYVKLPEVHGVGGQVSGAVPEWITFTPDSKRVYISNSASRSVSAIDVEGMKHIAVIPVGEVPKRINTLVIR
jgi:YVTN family beta-propeller protein